MKITKGYLLAHAAGFHLRFSLKQETNNTRFKLMPSKFGNWPEQTLKEMRPFVSIYDNGSGVHVKLENNEFHLNYGEFGDLYLSMKTLVELSEKPGYLPKHKRLIK